MAHAQFKPEWIPQVFILSEECDYEFILGTEDVTIKGGYGVPQKIVIYPTSRKEANQLSILLRKASRRIEEIGKGLK